MTESFYKVFVQLIGFIGTGLILFSFKQNTNKKILFFQIFGMLVFTVHFILLGAKVASIMYFIGLVRNIIFYNRKKKWASSVAWFYFFIGLFVVVEIFVYKHWTDLFAMVGMILGSTALYMESPRKTRIIMIATSVMWLTYGIICGSIAGALTESVTIITLFIAIYSYDIKGRIVTTEDSDET